MCLTTPASKKFQPSQARTESGMVLDFLLRRLCSVQVLLSISQASMRSAQKTVLLFSNYHTCTHDQCDWREKASNSLRNQFFSNDKPVKSLIRDPYLCHYLPQNGYKQNCPETQAINNQRGFPSCSAVSLASLILYCTQKEINGEHIFKFCPLAHLLTLQKAHSRRRLVLRYHNTTITKHWDSLFKSAGGKNPLFIVSNY